LPTGARKILFLEYLPSIENLLCNMRDIAKYRKKTVAQVIIIIINFNICYCFQFYYIVIIMIVIINLLLKVYHSNNKY
jgi:hypothetical protein